MSKVITPVDFSNSEALEKALDEAAQNAANKTDAADAAPKEKKPPKPRIVKVTYTADKDYAAGDVIEFNYELPKSEGTRGQVAGMTLDEMNDAELKIEYRNASSVHYKTKKAGRDATKAEERVNAVKAEMTKRGIQPNARTAAPITAQDIVKMIRSGELSVDELQAMLEKS